MFVQLVRFLPRFSATFVDLPIRPVCEICVNRQDSPWKELPWLIRRCPWIAFFGDSYTRSPEGCLWMQLWLYLKIGITQLKYWDNIDRYKENWFLCRS
jgi:hypothetical protein